MYWGQKQKNTIRSVNDPTPQSLVRTLADADAACFAQVPWSSNCDGNVAEGSLEGQKYFAVIPQ